MQRLPKWILNHRFPSVYDSDSKTVIEQTARVYGAMNDLIDQYNEYVEKLNNEITEFETGVTDTESCFRNNIVKIMNEYIESIDNKIANLETYLKLNVDKTLTEWVENGELDTSILNAFNNLEQRVSLIEQNANELVYNPESESLNMTEV